MRKEFLTKAFEKAIVNASRFSSMPQEDIIQLHESFLSQLSKIRRNPYKYASMWLVFHKGTILVAFDNKGHVLMEERDFGVDDSEKCYVDIIFDDKYVYMFNALPSDVNPMFKSVCDFCSLYDISREAVTDAFNCFGAIESVMYKYVSSVRSVVGLVSIREFYRFSTRIATYLFVVSSVSKRPYIVRLLFWDETIFRTIQPEPVMCQIFLSDLMDYDDARENWSLYKKFCDENWSLERLLDEVKFAKLVSLV